MFGEQIEISGREVQFALQIFDIALVVGIERRALPNLKAVDADAVPDPLTARFEERLGRGGHVGGDGIVLRRQEACLSGVAENVIGRGFSFRALDDADRERDDEDEGDDDRNLVVVPDIFAPDGEPPFFPDKMYVARLEIGLVRLAALRRRRRLAFIHRSVLLS